MKLWLFSHQLRFVTTVFTVLVFMFLFVSHVSAADCSSALKASFPSEIKHGESAEFKICFQPFAEVTAIQLLVTENSSRQEVMGKVWTVNPGVPGGYESYSESRNTANWELGSYSVSVKAWDNATRETVYASDSGSFTLVTNVVDNTDNDDDTTGGDTNNGGNTNNEGDTNNGGSTDTNNGSGSADSTSGIGTIDLSHPSSLDKEYNLVPGDKNVDTISEIYQLIINVLRYLIMVAAVIGVMWGAIQLLEYGGNPQKIANGKKVIIASIVGLLLGIFTNVIINTAITTVQRTSTEKPAQST